MTKTTIKAKTASSKKSPVKPKATAQAKTRAKAKAKAKDQTNKRKPEAALPLEWRLLRAAFDVIEEKGWRAFEIADAVHYGKLNAEDVALFVSRKSDLLLLLADYVDEAMLVAGETEGDAQDRLFDMVMRRYEALRPWRQGIALIAREIWSDPTALFVLAPSFHQSLDYTLAAADLEVTPTHRLGLGAVALSTFSIWLADESPDLTQTMAAVDRRLSQWGELAQLLEGVRGHR